MWTFLDFLDGRGENTIRQWLDSLPLKPRAKINTRLLFMRSAPIWPEQYVSSLTSWPDLVELRIVSSGDQYRPIGFFGPGKREFTLVLGAIEKGKLRARTLEVADANRKIVAATGRSRIVEHEFDNG